eukprot:2178599-Alexandrium_andersonii.AAC.1
MTSLRAGAAAGLHPVAAWDIDTRVVEAASADSASSVWPSMRDIKQPACYAELERTRASSPQACPASPRAGR